MAFARPHSSAADATFSATGAAAWNANQTPTGADVGGIPYCPTATTETTSAGFTFNGSTLAIAMGAITTAIGPQTWTETRNSSGTTFPGLKYTITDTASAAGSLAMQILGGASGTTNLFSVGKAGNIFAGAGTASLPTLALGTANTGIYNANGAGNHDVGFTLNGTRTWSFQSVGAYCLTDAASHIVFGVSNDTGVKRQAAGVVRITNGSTGGGALELLEQTAPAGLSNAARIFTQDDGAGKTQLMVIFGSGAAQQIAIEA